MKTQVYWAIPMANDSPPQELEEKPEITKILIFLGLVFFVGIPLGNYFSRMIQNSKERLIAEQGILQIPPAVERYHLEKKEYPEKLDQLIPEQMQGIIGYDFKPGRYRNIKNLKLVPHQGNRIHPRIEFEVLILKDQSCTIYYDWDSQRWVGEPTHPDCKKIRDYFQSSK